MKIISLEHISEKQSLIISSLIPGWNKWQCKKESFTWITEQMHNLKTDVKCKKKEKKKRW